ETLRVGHLQRRAPLARLGDLHSRHRHRTYGKLTVLTRFADEELHLLDSGDGWLARRLQRKRLILGSPRRRLQELHSSRPVAVERHKHTIRRDYRTVRRDEPRFERPLAGQQPHIQNRLVVGKRTGQFKRFPLRIETEFHHALARRRNWLRVINSNRRSLI